MLGGTGRRSTRKCGRLSWRAIAVLAASFVNRAAEKVCIWSDCIADAHLGAIVLLAYTYLACVWCLEDVWRVRHQGTRTLDDHILNQPDQPEEASLVEGMLWACTGDMTLRAELVGPKEGASAGGEDGWYTFSCTTDPVPGCATASSGGEKDGKELWTVKYVYVSGSSAEANESDAREVPLRGVYYVCADDLPFVSRPYGDE